MQTAQQRDALYERHKSAELNAYLDKCAAAERHAEAVEERAKYLMQIGEDFHPWTFQNFTEAIENAPDAYRKTMFACIAEAVNSGLQNNHANHLALVAVRQLVERYWTECAAKAADAELA